MQKAAGGWSRCTCKRPRSGLGANVRCKETVERERYGSQLERGHCQAEAKVMERSGGDQRRHDVKTQHQMRRGPAAR